MRVGSAINTVQMFFFNHLTQLLRGCFWLVAIALGTLQAWAYRHEVGGDGVNYLDMGDAYFRGDWGTAVNALWSPLYSCLLALSLHIIKPSAYWEYTVVHFVNLLIFILTLVCFEFFLRQVIRYYQGRTGAGYWAIPTPLWMVIGYTLFIWSSLDLIGLAWVNPDMFVAGLVYLASGTLIRIRNGANSHITFALLGLILGIGYLAKTIMLPLAFVFLIVGMLSVGKLRRGSLRALTALVVLLLIVIPFVAALSKAKGRFTIGDSGKLNYAWYVNGIPDRHWQGQPSGSGVPSHPTRKLLDTPAVYEFGLPVGGTYPMWYDPSYWYEGVAPRFDWRQQIKTSIVNGQYILAIFLGLGGSLIVGMFLLLYMSRRTAINEALHYWFLLVPAVAAFILYSLIHVENRYVASFVVLLCVVAFASVRLPPSNDSARLTAGVAVAMLVMLFNPIGPLASRRYYSSAISLLRAREDFSNIHWRVADGVRQLGIKPGDKVASTNYANYNNVTWARLARVRIISEVYDRTGNADEGGAARDKNNFWKADVLVQKQILCYIANAGAKVIVADDAPNWAVKAGWLNLGDTGYYAYLLSDTARECSQPRLPALQETRDNQQANLRLP